MMPWTSDFDKVTVVLPRCCCLWARSAGHRQKASISTRGDTSALCVVDSTSMVMLRWTSEFDQVTVVWTRLCCLWAPSAIKRQNACIATLHSQKHRPHLQQKPAVVGPALPAWLEDDVPVEGSVADVPHLPYPHEALHLSKACARNSIFVRSSTT
jgi:phage gp36-like protein